jgi:DNA-binding SARP family transcriptional activator
VLRQGADVDGARLLDVALRAAAAGSGAAGLPPLRWVEVSEGGVLLVLAVPSPAPPGFISVQGDRWLTNGNVDELTAIAGRTEMPAPTLIPVGTTTEHAEVLVELEASGVVTVSGPPDECLGLLRAMAVAVATAPWAEQSRVVLVGMHGELMELPWVGSAGQLGEALAAAEAHVDRTTAALWSLRCQTTGQARASGDTPESWEPLVVVSTTRPNEPSERQRLASLASRPRSGVAVVTPSAERAVPLGRSFAIGDDGWLRIDGVDVEVWPDRLDDEDASVVVALLDVAAQRDDVAVEESPETAVRRPPPPVTPILPPPPGQVPEPPAAEVVPVSPPPTARPVEALLADVDVVVRVLGEVEAVRRTGPDSEKRLQPIRQKGLEAIVYLALRESSLDREELESKLFPDGSNAAKTVYNTVSAARSLVGDDLFPAPTEGRYELSRRVVTDYGLFCELVALAKDTEEVAASAELLTDALGLVRSEPFMGVGRNYAWVGAHRGMIVAQVIDAAEQLAEMQLARDDWRAAEWAARRGLRAFPSDERMHRLLMRTARAAGNIPGVQRVFRELCEVIADPDLGVEPEDTLHPETVALLEELTGSVPRRGQMGA